MTSVPVDWEFFRSYMPTDQVRSEHGIIVRSPPPDVYRALLDLDLERSATIRWLFRARGMPSSCGTLDGLQRIGFLLLAQRSDRELLLGIVGQFWKLSGSLLRLTPEEFRAFERRGYAKAVWGFRLQQLSDATTRVLTRTAVQCYGRSARLAFSVYWMAVGPFSSVIRRRTLQLIKQAAETERCR